jgi:hypothetical protein
LGIKKRIFSEDEKLGIKESFLGMNESFSGMNKYRYSKIALEGYSLLMKVYTSFKSYV